MLISYQSPVVINTHEFNENDLLERISRGLDISDSDYNKAECIQRLIDKGVPEKYAQTTIKITTKTDAGYIWDDSNPKGFKAWMDDVVLP